MLDFICSDLGIAILRKQDGIQHIGLNLIELLEFMLLNVLFSVILHTQSGTYCFIHGSM